MKIDRAHVEVVPDQGARLGILVTRLKCCLSAFCVVALLPLSAVAQITEPLRPYSVPINLPQLPARGEQPISLGQTVTSRPHPEFVPIVLRWGNFLWCSRAELFEFYNG